MTTIETTGSTVDPSKTAKAMNDANTDQMSQALIIQSYCNSIAEQYPVDFGDEPTLKNYQTKINDGLNLAQTHGTYYLNVLQPKILTNMSNIANYYALNNSVVSTLPDGSTEAQWITALNTLRTEGTNYQQEASKIVVLLNKLQKELTMDVNAFSTTVGDLNNAVLGDNGTLDSLNGQLKTIQSQINGEIAGVTLGALAIVGGAIMICVGSIADFVTAGTTTPLVVGGIGIVVGGVSTDIGTAITLASLNKAKASLLTEETQLKDEVKLATGIQSGYSSLLSQVSRASDAALRMESEWKTLTEHLGTMVNDLKNGIMTTDQVQKLFLTSANTTVQKVIADINTIKLQMSGVSTNVAQYGQTVSYVIMTTAKANQKAYTTVSLVSVTPPPTKYTTLRGSLEDSGSTTSSVAVGMNNANQSQIGQALKIQNYANSVNEQPMVDFSDDPSLANFEIEINNGLKTAQTHANTYLNLIQPLILGNLSNIGNYYALHSAVATTLPAGSTTTAWIKALTALKKQSEVYQSDANGVVTQLKNLTKNLSRDTGTFSGFVTQLNGAVNGDNGVLESIKSQLHTIQKQIDGAIAGTVLSGLAIVGGVFLAAVGGVADIFTGGASTPLVAGGVCLVAAGIGGEAASAVILKKLNDEKAGLLTEQANLTAEVKLVTGISGGYQTLADKVSDAVTAATGMEAAWISLSKDLDNMICDLLNGIKNTGEVRSLFLTAANTVIQVVLKDTNIIKTQMAGVKNIVAPKGQTVGQAIVAAANANQALTTRTVVLLKRPTTAASGGNLSQSVANLNQAEQQVKNVVNLPPAAENIKTQSLTNIPLLISQIQVLQGSVANFVNTALPQLKDAETQEKANQPWKNIRYEVAIINSQAITLNSFIGGVAGAIQRTINSAYTYINQLAVIQGNLTTQRSQLQGQLGTAQSQESAAKQKYYYLLGLGPFGLPGLAASLALYTSLQNDVNHYQDEINSLNNQINSLDAMNVATGLLSTQFTNVVNSATGLKNSVIFLSNDTLQTILDTSTPKDTAVYYITAAITEVQTLGTDAS